MAAPGFLTGCGLPDAWANRPQWLILETNFGVGLQFLTTWQAWRADPTRPRLLHFSAITALAVGRDDILRVAQSHAELGELAELLAAQWHGLLPGFHRLAFDEGRVLLTLCIGDLQPMLRAQHFEADSIFLHGKSVAADAGVNPLDLLKGVARFARLGTRLVATSASGAARAGLTQCGFKIEDASNAPTAPTELSAVFAPAWTVRRRTPAKAPVEQGGSCVIVGAGIAGAAVASSLARRGWRVTVLDAASTPAAGASALPVGLVAPHVSPDDALLSRITRAGIRITWQQLEQLLERGKDWLDTGALERRDTGDEPPDARFPHGWTSEGPNESWRATAAQLRAAGLDEHTVAIHHARAGWVRPQRLVRAWLAQPGIEVRTGARAAQVVREGHQWSVLDEIGQSLARADRVIIAAGFDSRQFATALPLQAVRGQVAWGHAPHGQALPRTPINGDGHLIAGVPDADKGDLWLAGSTFDRDRNDTHVDDADARTNLDRIRRLHPAAATLLAPDFEQGKAQAWTGVRCASGDRRPLVGPIDPSAPDGVWACTAMGSRGLSFAALCAELLAAQWHGEPLPLPSSLAKALDTRRL